MADNSRVLAGNAVTSVGFCTPDRDLAALTSLVRSINSERLRIVEVGSWVGESALAMIEGADGRPCTICCVDTWEGSRGDVSGYTAGKIGHDQLFATFAGNCGAYLVGVRQQRIVPIPVASPGAAKLFRPGWADMVYIDGDHTTGAVLADINAWQPVVRTGGIFAGHDYEEVNGVLAHCGLKNLKVVGKSVWCMEIKEGANG